MWGGKRRRVSTISGYSSMYKSSAMRPVSLSFISAFVLMSDVNVVCECMECNVHVSNVCCECVSVWSV
jgi:hypothetical protein